MTRLHRWALIPVLFTMLLGGCASMEGPGGVKTYDLPGDRKISSFQGHMTRVGGAVPAAVILQGPDGNIEQYHVTAGNPTAHEMWKQVIPTAGGIVRDAGTAAISGHFLQKAYGNLEPATYSNNETFTIQGGDVSTEGGAVVGGNGGTTEVNTSAIANQTQDQHQKALGEGGGVGDIDVGKVTSNTMVKSVNDNYADGSIKNNELSATGSGSANVDTGGKKSPGHRMPYGF